MINSLEIQDYKNSLLHHVRKKGYGASHVFKVGNTWAAHVPGVGACTINDLLKGKTVQIPDFDCLNTVSI